MITGAGVEAVWTTPDGIGGAARGGAGRARASWSPARAWPPTAWRCWRAPTRTRGSCPSAAPTCAWRPQKRDLVKGLIYPVPDPSLPFLGVHLTLHMDGEVSLGPTALLAPAGAQPDLARHVADGHALVAHRRWPRCAAPCARSEFAREAAQYVPELEPGDFSPYFAGYRAQALGRDGALVDDFVIHETAARAARAQRAVAGGHVVAGHRRHDRRARPLGHGRVASRAACA